MAACDLLDEAAGRTSPAIGDLKPRETELDTFRSFGMEQARRENHQSRPSLLGPAFLLEAWRTTGKSLFDSSGYLSLLPDEEADEGESDDLESTWPSRFRRHSKSSRCHQSVRWLLLGAFLAGSAFFLFFILVSITGASSEESTSESQPRTSLGHVFLPARPTVHPINTLIREANAEWDAKVSRQSKTLKEAVQEYERRNSRAPPKGFEDWYAFATKHNVSLVDEYDSINQRLLPFASLPPYLLRQRSDLLQTNPYRWLANERATIRIRSSIVDVVGGTGDYGLWRVGRVAELLEGIAEWLPDLNITGTARDEPSIVVSGEAMDRHITAAREGRYIDPEYYDEVGENDQLDGLALTCPPDSALRQALPFAERMHDTPPDHVTFVKDQLASTNVCTHPYQQVLHGFTSSEGKRPGLLFPHFTFSTTAPYADLLFPPIDTYSRAGEVGPDPAWQEKKDKVVWRGHATGANFGTNPIAITNSQRSRLVMLPLQKGNKTLHLSLKDEGPTTLFTEDAGKLAEKYFDFRYVGPPIQCGKRCDEFEAAFDWTAPAMSEEQQNQYKYQMDVDGNGWSGRFSRLMGTNSVILKSTIFPEWYVDRVQPWVHYVPVSVDYSDLWSIMAFFVGDLDGRGGHDHLAEKIAVQGKQWRQEYWRWEDMQAYFLRLLLEASH